MIIVVYKFILSMLVWSQPLQHSICVQIKALGLNHTAGTCSATSLCWSQCENYSHYNYFCEVVTYFTNGW